MFEDEGNACEVCGEAVSNFTELLLGKHEMCQAGVSGAVSVEEMKIHDSAADYIDLAPTVIHLNVCFTAPPSTLEAAETELKDAERALAALERKAASENQIVDAQRTINKAKSYVAQQKDALKVKVMGYDAVRVPSEDYYCPICLLVARDAVAHTCGKLFCASCWKDWNAHGQGCSCCKEQGEVFPALRDRKIISNLMMKCPACKGEFRIGDYEKHHTTECNQRRVICVECREESTPASMLSHLAKQCVSRPVKCSACQEVSKFMSLQDHRATACIQRFVPCEGCSESVRFCELAPHKNRACAARSIVCPECPQTTTPRDLSTHLVSTCLNRPLPCSLCDALVKKSGMPEHLKASMEVHLTSLIQQVFRLQQDVIALQSENQQLRARAQARPIIHSSHPRCFLEFVGPQLGSRECDNCGFEGTGLFGCPCDSYFCSSCLQRDVIGI